MSKILNQAMRNKLQKSELFLRNRELFEKRAVKEIKSSLQVSSV